MVYLVIYRSTYAILNVRHVHCSSTGASYAAVDTWLAILHAKKAQPNYEKLPKNSRAMFETSQLENAVRIGAMEAQATKSTAAAEQRIHAASSVGQYVYFGLHETLLARTPGLYLRRAYIAMLRRVNASNTTVLSESLYNIAYEAEEQYKKAHEHFNPTGPRLHEPRPRSVLLTLKIFTDGVQVFQNSTKSSLYPLLIQVHALCPIDVGGHPDRTRTVRVPSEKSPPIIIAAFLGKGKPTYEFWHDFMEEFKSLSPGMQDVAAPKPCLVEVLCVICDTPVRLWLTGTK